MSDQGRLRHAIEKFFREYDFGTIISGWLKIIRENDEVELVQMMDNLIDLYIEAAKNIPELSSILRSVKSKKHQVGSQVLAGMAQSVGGSLLGGVSSPLANTLNMRMNQLLQNSIFDPQTGIRLQQLGKLTLADEHILLTGHGFRESDAQLLDSLYKNRLDAPQLLQLGLRFTEDKSYIEQEVSKRGWDEKSLELVKKSIYQWPSVQDWILFAVREATNEQRAKELGLDGGDWGIAEQEASKAGLAPGYFKYYWRSHWVLPPVTMGYEFLHRFRHNTDDLKFDDKDLSSLIQALDYAPIWHKRMMESSYKPITRVDIRRVLKAGMLDEKGVRDAYWKDGYSDKDADILTDWTMWEAQSSERDLSLAKIEKAYKRGMMTGLESQNALQELRYSDTAIAWYIKLWDYDIEEERVSAEIDYLSAQYMAGEFDEVTLRSKLTNLGLTSNNVVVAVVNLNAKKKRQVTALTTVEIKELYENDIISFAEVLPELISRGVNPVNANRMVKLIDIKVQEARAKELTAQEKEQARIVNDANSTAKQIELAKLSVKIAEVRAETADLKILATQDIDADTQQALADHLLTNAKEIAFLNLEKAKVNLTYREKAI